MPRGGWRLLADRHGLPGDLQPVHKNNSSVSLRSCRRTPKLRAATAGLQFCGRKRQRPSATTEQLSQPLNHSLPARATVFCLFCCCCCLFVVGFFIFVCLMLLSLFVCCWYFCFYMFVVVVCLLLGFMFLFTCCCLLLFVCWWWFFLFVCCCACVRACVRVRVCVLG